MSRLLRPHSAAICCAIVATLSLSVPARAAGRIDADSLIAIPHGVFNDIPYVRYEAMFEGVSSYNRSYRVPCQFVVPLYSEDGCGLVLFEWINRTAVFAIGQELPFGRFILTDDFLFSGGASFATVRCDPVGIGRPWSDRSLDTSSEFIKSPGDEYDIVVDFVKALDSDPVASKLLGEIDRLAAIGYSASGWRLRGLLRVEMGKGLFDFSLVGGCGTGFDYPTKKEILHSFEEKSPPAEVGLELDFCTEAEVIHPVFSAAFARHDETNYRSYELAGGTHLWRAALLSTGGGGLPDPEKANPADWSPFVRGLFLAGNNWCDGIEPPPSIWLGAPKDGRIARDANGNALVTHVGGKAVSTTGYRLPEVAVGENRYIAYDPRYEDSTLIGLLRAIMGGYVDLTANFTDHDAYVDAISNHARRLQKDGYLLKPDADSIILRAAKSDIGK